MYASSGSVYGVKEEPNVTEDLTLVPISVYNKTKMVAERVFLSYADKMHIHCIRPATVCGLSPRMRLRRQREYVDVSSSKKWSDYCLRWEQTRPNIHIKDLANIYRHFLRYPKIASGCYNAGFENLKIKGIAEQSQKANRRRNRHHRVK